jgi:LysM repeat protein
VVQAGDTLSGIGARLGIDWQAIAQLNGIAPPYTIYPGQRLALPDAGGAPAERAYIVQSGDTLSGIGEALGVDWHDIAARNGIEPPYTIYPGQRLVY